MGSDGVAWSDVAEAEHVHGRATASHGRQARHVLAPLVAIERVEHPAIRTLGPARRGLLARDRQRGFRDIDAHHWSPRAAT
jgi:hypothetical protein